MTQTPERKRNYRNRVPHMTDSQVKLVTDLTMVLTDLFDQGRGEEAAVLSMAIMDLQKMYREGKA